jgi:hypothetical protein
MTLEGWNELETLLIAWYEALKDLEEDRAKTSYKSCYDSSEAMTFPRMHPNPEPGASRKEPA